MKTKAYFVLLTAIIISVTSFGQSTICIPYGSTPTIDGSQSAGEWSDANTTLLSILGGTDDIEIYFKHDSLNLHLLFVGKLHSSFIRCPEVFLDINNDKGSTWQSDDWWFHVSATDCEYQGEHSNYANCELVRPNWTAANNFPSTAPPFADTIEIQIPFATVGIDINSGDTIGIAFDVTNTATLWEYWPTTADIDLPSTWANAVFCGSILDIDQGFEDHQFKIFPNPNDGTFSIELNEAFMKDELPNLKLMNSLGEPVEIDFTYEAGLINVSARHDLSSGVYVLHMDFESGTFSRRILIQ